MSVLPPHMPAHYIAIRFCVFLALWLLLTKANLGALPFAMVLVPIATLVSLYLFKPNRTYYATLNVLFIPQFLVYFFKESILGGINTALLALNPKAVLQPTLIEMPVKLKNESSRVVFAQVVSLLPGTLSVNLENNTLLVHTLNQNKNATIKALTRCEYMMTRLFSGF